MTEDLPWNLAMDICEILVATGRTVHPRLWVDKFVNEAAQAELMSLPHNDL